MNGDRELRRRCMAYEQGFTGEVRHKLDCTGEVAEVAHQPEPTGKPIHHQS